MTKLAYLDCQTGIAGDMCLGALVAAGVPLEYLSEKLKGLGIEQEYQLRSQPVHRNGQLATKVHVDLLGLEKGAHFSNHSHDHYHSHEHQHDRDRNTTVHSPTRHLPEIERMITAARLPPRATQWSLAVFRKLAEAEGAVHGITPEQVHFHEVGATDAIVDIVGTCLGLDWLGIDRLYCSALPTGGGTVRAAHGRLPVPAPAVLKLWELGQVPVYSNGIERELVTPTGAALAVTLATHFGHPPAMTIQKVGLGAGSIELPIPNILRLWIGENLESWQVSKLESFNGPSHYEKFSATINSRNEPSNLPTFQPSNPNKPSNPIETIAVLETQIDDSSPQAIGYVFEALFEAGAVDVFTQAIGMKKCRPGILLTAICHPQDIEACEAVLFRETTTLGVRRLTQQRAILPREIQRVQTELGEIRVKVAWTENGSSHRTITNVQPEYEDCAKLAKIGDRSWREVHQLALQAWYRMKVGY